MINLQSGTDSHVRIFIHRMFDTAAILNSIVSNSSHGIRGEIGI